MRKPALDPSDIVRKCYRAGISERAANCLIVLSGQAPKPLSGAPKARGLTVKARIERSWMLPRMQIGSDIVREIKYQILHLITRLQAAGVDTWAAQRILGLLELNLRRFEEHRDWLRATGPKKT